MYNPYILEEGVIEELLSKIIFIRPPRVENKILELNQLTDLRKLVLDYSLTNFLYVLDFNLIDSSYDEKDFLEYTPLAIYKTIQNKWRERNFENINHL